MIGTVIAMIAATFLVGAVTVLYFGAKIAGQLVARAFNRPQAPESAQSRAPWSGAIPQPQKPAPGAAPGAGPSLDSSLETWAERFGANWSVWLGALALIVGGGLLVKYSIDHGLLSPQIRIALAAVFGLALSAAGEYSRSRWPSGRIEGWTVPAPATAATGAGLVILFGSIFSAYGLYGLLPPLAAFLLLAAVTMAAVGLSLLHGPVLALLGVAGGFATPLLVTTGEPAAAALFPYLFMLHCAVLYLVRRRGWHWLGGLAIGASLLWSALWFNVAWRPQDAPVIAFFLAAVLITGLRLLPPEAGWRPGAGIARRVAAAAENTNLLLWALVAAVSLLAFVFLRMDRYGPASLMTMAMVTVAVFAFARVRPGYDWLIVLPAAVTVVAIGVWHVPQLIAAQVNALPPPGAGYGFVVSHIEHPEVRSFMAVCAVFAALYAIAGFTGVRGAGKPVVWATVASAVPMLLLLVAYGRIGEFRVSYPWASVSLAMAFAYLGAAAWLVRGSRDEVPDACIGAFAIGVVAATSLAFGMTLRHVWLTVAIAVQLPAIAWVARTLGVESLRRVAWLVAVVAGARLLANPRIFDYPLDRGDLLGWPVWGYGLCAACFIGAARMFETTRRDRLTEVLRAGGIVFLAALIAAELRIALIGGLTGPVRGLLEQSLHTVAWVVFAAALRHPALLRRSPVHRVLSNAMLIGAGLNTAIGHLLVQNPMLVSMPADLPLTAINLLAYLLPAVVALAVHLRGAPSHGGLVRRAALALGLVLLINFAVVEARILLIADDGPFPSIALRALSEGEVNAFSGTLMTLGIAGLATSVVWRLRDIRLVATGLIAFVAVKVFVFDLATLTGVHRAASFLALGAVLLAVGWLYQRFPLSAAASAENAAATPQ